MSVVNFGKYRGTELREVPTAYLQGVAPFLMAQARLLTDELERRTADCAVEIVSAAQVG